MKILRHREPAQSITEKTESFKLIKKVRDRLSIENTLKLILKRNNIIQTDLITRCDRSRDFFRACQPVPREGPGSISRGILVELRC